MMAKVRGLKSLQDTLRSLGNMDRRTLLQIGQFSRNRIFNFTKDGKSIAGDRPQRLKPLARSTIESRRSFRGQTGSGFSPGKSNLTLTGQLLDSLKAKVKDADNSVEISAEGRRRGSRLSNDEVAGFVAKNGRPFIGMDDRGIETIKDIVLSDVSRKLRGR